MNCSNSKAGFLSRGMGIRVQAGAEMGEAEKERVVPELQCP